MEHGLLKTTRLPKPDFFIVGAPKCGTSALYAYLKQHPEIFMSKRKEPFFFGADLHGSTPRSLEKYLSYFAGAGQESRIGEASTAYLHSLTAAAEIKEFNPAARIIIMLRNPVDMLYSLHSQRLYEGWERVRDFGAVLEAEEERERRAGLEDPPNAWKRPRYRYLVRFADHVQRYFDVFGRENVHVILLDDFKKDTGRVYRETLSFLGVDPDFRPHFRVVNPNKTLRSNAVHRFLVAPPLFVQWLVRLVLRKRMRERLFALVRRLNAQQAPRRPMDPALRKRLQAEFADEVKRLGELLGRDLSHWSRD